MTKSVALKVSSAILVGGKLVKAGELVEVTMAEAKDLLHRGKATLAVSKPAVAIHFTDEVHVPEAPAAIEEAEQAEEAPAEQAKPKRAKKAK